MLKACTSAGDIAKARDVFNRLTNDEQYHDFGMIKPNDTTWKELLLVAAKTGNIASAVEIWNMAVTEYHWKPNLDSLEIMLSIYTKLKRWNDVIHLYDYINVQPLLSHGNSNDDDIPILGLEFIDINDFTNHSKIMNLVFRAAVVLDAMHDEHYNDNCEGGCSKKNYRHIKSTISNLDCFQPKRK